MTTPKEMAKFLNDLPEDEKELAVVMVVQAGNHRMIMWTNNLEAPYPNWPKSVVEGFCDAVGMSPLQGAK